MRPQIKPISDADVGSRFEATTTRGRVKALALQPRAVESAPPPKRPPAAFALSAPLTMIALASLAMAAFGFKEKIVRALPRLAPAYAAAGLPVNLVGLELRGVHSQILRDGERKVLAIEGEIVNLRREANAVPPVSLTVRGANGLPKYAWTTRAPKTRLGAGETISFRARLASPPEGGADVLVRFAGLDAAGKSVPAQR
jgi:hypothetical protein